MKTVNGYYSLIQYCPDPSRAEAANVGVLLFCPELNFVRATLSRGNDRVSKFFGRTSFDRTRLNQVKRSIEARLIEDKDSFHTLDDLMGFILTRANEIKVTKPRVTKLTDPVKELSNLFDELVGERAHQQKEEEQPFSTLDALMRRPSLQTKVRYNLTVELPVVRRVIEVPYAYNNGALNLVKPQVFLIDNRGLEKAMSLAWEGTVLRKYPDNGSERHLIVIPLYKTTERPYDFDEQVKSVFAENEIRTVDSDRLEEFAEEVESEAH